MLPATISTYVEKPLQAALASGVARIDGDVVLINEPGDDRERSIPAKFLTYTKKAPDWGFLKYSINYRTWYDIREFRQDGVWNLNLPIHYLRDQPDDLLDMIDKPPTQLWQIIYEGGSAFDIERIARQVAERRGLYHHYEAFKDWEAVLFSPFSITYHHDPRVLAVRFHHDSEIILLLPPTSWSEAENTA